MGKKINGFQFLFGFIYLLTGNFSEGTRFTQVNENSKYLVVHLDLTGVQPKLAYLYDLLDHLRRLDVNGLLIEYGDAFPFQNKLRILRASAAYNEDELSEFIRIAVEEGFEIIPLVEIIGNLNYVLQNQKFINLRESNKSTDSICPSKDDSNSLLLEILKQVINFHKKIAPLKYLHVGCDDIYHINECNSCRERNLISGDIFERHVAKIYSFVQGISTDTKILMWDNNMLREKISSPFGFPIQPVVQHNNESQPSLGTLQKYQIHYETMWAASDFKGIDGLTTTFPDLKMRYHRHYHWIKNLKYLILENGFHITGIILRGCSKHRYTQQLTELLTSSIPSLYICLYIMEAFKKKVYKFYDFESKQESILKKYVLKNLKDDLRCDNIYDDKIDQRYFSNCNYTGSEINAGLMNLSRKFDSRRDIAKVVTYTTVQMSKYYDQVGTNHYINQKINLLVKAYEEDTIFKRKKLKRPVLVESSNNLPFKDKYIKLYLDKLKNISIEDEFLGD